MEDRLDDEMVGKVGRVTLGITPESRRRGHSGDPGRHRGLRRLCDEPIAKNARVVVVECLSGRTVSVTPC